MSLSPNSHCVQDLCFITGPILVAVEVIYPGHDLAEDGLSVSFTSASYQRRRRRVSVMKLARQRSAGLSEAASSSKAQRTNDYALEVEANRRGSLNTSFQLGQGSVCNRMRF